MTTIDESGAHITAQRLRKDAAAVECVGFRLFYQRPLSELSLQHDQRTRAMCHAAAHRITVGKRRDGRVPGDMGNLA